jgi:hypothetical protein
LYQATTQKGEVSIPIPTPFKSRTSTAEFSTPDEEIWVAGCPFFRESGGFLLALRLILLMT